MAPSTKAIKDALVQGTCDVFKLEPDTTSVNKVRSHVEGKLGLEEGFLSKADWKQQSKEAIKEYVGKLVDGWVPEVKKTDAKKSTAADSDDDADAPTRGSSSPDRKRKRTAATAADDGDDGKDESNKKAKSESKSPDPVVDEEEEYSDVIDEPPPTRRKKTKKEPGQKAAKASKAAARPPKAGKKASASTAAEPSDPEEAEIKKLQGQLTKCGMRKLWHHELKDCDDARSKIRHLKKMLADIGMEGRFSEAKAREIKETRELLADAEAAQEMNRLWGMDSGGRKSRNKSRGAKVLESDGSDAENGNGHHGDDDDGDDGAEKEGGEGNGNDDDEDVSFAARRRRAHADLAFLGDDSDSD